MAEHKLQVIPLGGLGEFGKNMMAVRYGDDIIVLDAGMTFPEAELLGVDIVIPDFTYLKENAEHVRAFILTHGHEDHIGAVPYVLAEINRPVYGTPFTLALVEGKLEEHGLLGEVKLHEVKPKQTIQIGPFSLEYIHVTHSIVDAAMLAITTPLGVILHTGDFKIDPTPTDGELFDLHTVAEYGKRGVLALFSDSTNVERPGMTPSERAVRPGLERIIAQAQNRVYVSCFSSSIHRIQLIVELAQKARRKVAFLGRSVTNTTEIAHRLGFLNIPDGMLLRPQDIRSAAKDRVAVIITGCQGEPMSGLARAAVEDHRQAIIESGDTVVLSSRVIPGNEKPIYRMINHLCRRGADVVYDDGAHGMIHVSGHASQEELLMMLNLAKPKYFIPMHGEYRHLLRHARLASHIEEIKETFIIETGDVLEFDADGARKAGKVPTGRLCIDSGSIDEVVEDMIIRDRRHISEDGIVIPVIAINKESGHIESYPEIISRGFVGGDDTETFLDSAKEIIVGTLEKSSSEVRGDYGLIKDKIRADLKRYIKKQTSRHPLILPVILEI